MYLCCSHRTTGPIPDQKPDPIKTGGARFLAASLLPTYVKNGPCDSEIGNGLAPHIDVAFDHGQYNRLQHPHYLWVFPSATPFPGHPLAHAARHMNVEALELPNANFERFYVLLPYSRTA